MKHPDLFYTYDEATLLKIAHVKPLGALNEESLRRFEGIARDDLRVMLDTHDGDVEWLREFAPDYFTVPGGEPAFELLRIDLLGI